MQRGTRPLYDGPPIGQCEPELQLRCAAEPLLPGPLVLGQRAAHPGNPGVGGFVNDGRGDLGQAVPRVDRKGELHQALARVRKERTPARKALHHDLLAGLRPGDVIDVGAEAADAVVEDRRRQRSPLRWRRGRAHQRRRCVRP